MRCFLLLLLLMGAGCSSTTPGAPVSRATMGNDWPLTVEEGWVSCEGPALLFTHESVTYAINGTAMTWAEDRGWRDIRPIWAASLEHPRATPKKNLGPLMDTARDACSASQ